MCHATQSTGGMSLKKARGEQSTKKAKAKRGHVTKAAAPKKKTVAKRGHVKKSAAPKTKTTAKRGGARKTARKAVARKGAGKGLHGYNHVAPEPHHVNDPDPGYDTGPHTPGGKEGR